MQSKIHEQLVETALIMVMVMEAALKTEDQVVSQQGWRLLTLRLLPHGLVRNEGLSRHCLVGYSWTAVDGCPLL